MNPISSLYEHIKRLAHTQPDSEAIVEYRPSGRSYTFAQLKEEVEKAASLLLDYAQPGEVVALAFSNSSHQLILSWAAWSIGIITTPLDVKRDTIEEHEFKASLTKSKVVFAEKNYFSEEDKKKLRVVEVDRISKGNTEPQFLPSTDHQCLILFTSGTTAKPKGAQLSLQNLIANADGIKEWFSVTSKDRFLVVLPLHHINSTTFCLTTLLAGAANCIVPSYSKSHFWEQVAHSQATFTSIVQTIAFDLLSEKASFDAVKKDVKLSRIQIGSAPVVPSDAKAFIDLYNIPLYQGYGQTETALRVTGVPHDLSQEQYEEMVASNSIGCPMKWADVQIMGSDDEILKEGEEGELVVKGPVIMKGYLGLDTGFRSGWFATGDLGYFKVIGNRRFFFLKGRIKEIIIKGGINISPVAVEDRLKKLDANIDQAYVVSVPDARYTEEVGAAIIWKEGSRRAVARLKDVLLRLDNYELPRYITSITSSNLPLTSTGKVQRSVLKDKIKGDQWEVIDEVARKGKVKFIRLTPRSHLVREALALYNHCWQPLTIGKETFKQHLASGVVIAAVSDEVEGIISAVVTDDSEEKLSKHTYASITANQTLSNSKPQGSAVVCVSICSSRYVPEEVPQPLPTPTQEEVERYLSHDPVFRFHEKPKGGFEKGAKLVKLLPNARPDDERALGYCMLLRYPDVTSAPDLASSSLAAQLIEAAMIFAHARGIERVYAFSRPINAAKYFKHSA